MPRQKNDGRGRLGGRQKGTPNKTTSTIKNIIAQCWKTYHESGQLQDDLQQLDPATRVVVMERYAQYIVPKMKSVDLEMEARVTSTTISQKLISLCGPDDTD